jgi:threonine synthase
MQFHSTRNDGGSAPISTAIREGLAPDGGLYVPEKLPELGPEAFEGMEEIDEIAARLLRPFFSGDVLDNRLESICGNTFGFPVPTRRLGDETALLELFHGPTAAFKDFGAAFLASSLGRLESGEGRDLTVLVATSGDTGAAVSAAFDGRPGCEVVVLYPKGRVSERQRALLTCWGETVTSLAVQGDFDDCQRIVKEAFADEWWEENRRLSSANSINVGRLMPQVTYYAQASLELWRDTGRRPDFVVPTGNAGNVLGCVYAREMGLPIGRVVAATNENRPITHYLKTGRWETFETEQTLATAMDVGNPSNFERIRHHWPSAEKLREQMTAETVSDEQIRRTIRRGPDRWGEIWDPHTACAVAVREQLDSELAVVVATAHPAKFPDVVEPLVGREVAIPRNMARMLERSTSELEIAPTLDALTDAVRGR